jgi:ATP-dependent DNA helicase PIF1
MEDLSLEQNYAFDKFKEGENVFITGKAGTGKTFLIKKIVENLKQRHILYKVCALTGCAAILLDCDATTLHSLMGIGIANGDAQKVIKFALSRKKKMTELKQIAVLVIDEVSMLSEKIIQIIEYICRIVKKSQHVFGKIQIVMTGDFFQLPPIETKGEPDTARFCFESPLWSKLFTKENHIELKTMFRQKDPVYRSILSEVRDGRLSQESVKILKGRLTAVYDPALHNGCVPSKIFATRINVDHTNRRYYSELTGPEHVFEFVTITNAITYIETTKFIPYKLIEECNELSTEHREDEIKKMITGSNFPQRLRLKIGTVVMCVANIDIDQQICNGSQGIVTGFSKEGEELVPTVKFYNGVVKKLIRRNIQNDDYPCFVVSQIPLIHAWAVSIHKCQGATMDIAEIDVGRSIFEYGQTYVALSRVKTLDGLYLSGLDISRIMTNPLVEAFYESFADNIIPIPAESTGIEITETAEIEADVPATADNTDCKKILFNQYAYNPDATIRIKKI